MFLRNYYNYLACLATGVISTDTTTFGDGHINFKTKSGTLSSIANNASGAYFSTGFCTMLKEYGASGSGDSSGCSRLVFGTGTTAPTYEDFDLENPIMSNILKSSFVAGTPTYDSSSKKFTNTLTFLLTNQSTTEMTITEIGIFSAGSSFNYAVLFYREILVSPIVLTAGQSVTATINLEYQMPEIGGTV